MCGMEYVENSAATDAFQLNANNAATAIVNNLNSTLMKTAKICYIVFKS